MESWPYSSKRQKLAVVKSVMVLLRQSLDEIKITDIYRLAYVTLIHKEGFKVISKQYRPVHSTSLEIKVLERVIKGHKLNHLIKNSYLNKGQQGFAWEKETTNPIISSL